MTTFFDNFPFESPRQYQTQVLNEIAQAFDSGYRYIIVEAPSGFGKSAVAVAVARTLGSSYICNLYQRSAASIRQGFSLLESS